MNDSNTQASRNLPYGQSLIEMMCGLVILLIIVAFLIDAMVLVQAGMINGDLAARAARAAANQANATDATGIATEVENKFATSTLISKVESVVVTWNSPVNGQLTVDSIIDVNVPFAIPFANTNPVKLHTQSVGAIMGKSSS